MNSIDSGGHFNPAVTIGILIAKGIEFKKALLYILMQLIGGIMAAGILRVNRSISLEDKSSFLLVFSSFSRMRIPIVIVMVEQHLL